MRLTYPHLPLYEPMKNLGDPPLFHQFLVEESGAIIAALESGPGGGLLENQMHLARMESRAHYVMLLIKATFTTDQKEQAAFEAGEAHYFVWHMIHKRGWRPVNSYTFTF